MKKYFSGITLIALGTLLFLQSAGIYYFGLTLWPTVVLWLGLEMIWGSLLHGHHGHHRPSLFGAGLGAVVGGWGLTHILANGGFTAAYTVREWFQLTWPVLLVTLGISLLFGRRHWHIYW